MNKTKDQETKAFVGMVESRNLEWKRSLSETKEVVQTACAFANTAGGRIVVGVDDSGEIRGIDIGKRTGEQFVHGHWNIPVPMDKFLAGNMLKIPVYPCAKPIKIWMIC